ncbi:MAG: gfo/Idh/MocA family oxidoreductase, partial [Vicinamibacterales bacterium]
QKEIDAALAEFQPELEHYAGQFVRFHSALENGTPLPATLADARQSLELITAIYYSSETGQPVDLPLPKSHPNYATWTPAEWRTPK